MRERPIIFSAPMVRAILDGRKTQTRRVVKPQPAAGVRRSVFAVSGLEDGHGREIRLSYGVPGDRLWVRETGEILSAAQDHDPIQNQDVWYDVGWRHLCDGTIIAKDGHHGRLTEFVDECATERKPAIFMPRWASRLTLEITAVRVQRVQDISEADAEAEGCEPAIAGTCGDGDVLHTYRTGFVRLWNEINGKKSGRTWLDSPWVWALTFRVMRDAPRWTGADTKADLPR